MEVADSLLRYDREEKRRAFASTGIRKFWPLNLEADVLEIYRHPDGNACREQLTIPAAAFASRLKHAMDSESAAIAPCSVFSATSRCSP